MPGNTSFPYPPQTEVDHIPFHVITELGKYASFFHCCLKIKCLKSLSYFAIALWSWLGFN